MKTNTAWMRNNLKTIGGKTLRQLCLPGTHDAGMGVFTSGTPFASKCNTITQTSLMLGQLELGSRYFDIRPVVSEGKYYTGHYTKIDLIGLSTWQGANGQSIESIITDINQFTSDNAELIIIHLSHDLDTDVGNNKYSSFTQEQWNELLSTMINRIKNLKIVSTQDLTQLTLNDYIGNNIPAVIVIVEPSDANISIDEFSDTGIYPASKFPVYNVYSNTNDANLMIDDQLRKMQEKKTSPDSSYFLLSWTLTQSAAQVSTCGIGLADSILDLANEANAVLYEKLLPACNANTFPNIVYIDAINQNTDIVSLAMSINNGLAGKKNPKTTENNNPIIFVHGRNADSGVWGKLREYLQTQGYSSDMFHAWNYDSSQSANEVLSGQFKNYVSSVLNNTGAKQVDIIAHSLGSLLTRWFIKFDDGNNITRHWISIAGPNHGTQLGWLCALWDQGCRDMTPGSYVITNLNKDTEVPGSTSYTTIWSPGDEQISPTTSTELSGATNIQVSQMKHNELLTSEEVFKHILNTLTSGN